MVENKRVCMSFDGEGNLVVFDESGKKIEPIKGDLCDIIGDGKAVNAGSIPFVEVRGSCYRWVYWGGWYRIPC